MIAWQGAMTRVKQFRSIEKFRQLCILQTDKIIVRSHNFQKKDVVTKPKHFFKIKKVLSICERAKLFCDIDLTNFSNAETFQKVVLAVFGCICIPSCDTFAVRENLSL